MARRKESETVQLAVRMKEPLRAALEDAARQRGVSMNAETVARLDASFADEARFGGPEMLAIVNLMAGAFLRGGQLGARACQHPDWSPAEWTADPFCYRTAVHSLIDALATAQPPLKFKEGVSPAEQDRTERFHELFAQLEVRNPGSIKVTRGEPKK